MRARTRDVRRRTPAGSCTPPRRPRHHRLAVVVGIALAAPVAVATPLATAPHASAHSALVATDPEAGAVLAAPPAQLTLTFNEELIEVGAAVFVVDESGVDHAGEPVVEGSVLTVPVVGELPAGDAELRWRVVSADGHPISDILPFTVEGAAPAASDAVAQEQGAASAAPIAEPSPAATEPADSAATADADEQGVPRTLIVGIAGAAAALVVLAIVLGVRRARVRRAARD